MDSQTFPSSPFPLTEEAARELAARALSAFEYVLAPIEAATPEKVERLMPQAAARLVKHMGGDYRPRNGLVYSSVLRAVLYEEADTFELLSNLELWKGILAQPAALLRVIEAALDYNGAVAGSAHQSENVRNELLLRLPQTELGRILAMAEVHKVSLDVATHLVRNTNSE